MRYWIMTAVRRVRITRDHYLLTEITRRVVAAELNEAVLDFHDLFGVEPEAFLNPPWKMMYCEVSKQQWHEAGA